MVPARRHSESFQNFERNRGALPRSDIPHATVGLPRWLRSLPNDHPVRIDWEIFLASRMAKRVRTRPDFRLRVVVEPRVHPRRGRAKGIDAQNCGNLSEPYFNSQFSAPAKRPLHHFFVELAGVIRQTVMSTLTLIQGWFFTRKASEAGFCLRTGFRQALGRWR